MPYQSIKLVKKIAVMNAENTMESLSYLSLIHFEEYDSPWLKRLEKSLKQFRKIDSEPDYSKANEKNLDYISWFESVLGFCKTNKEWLILVPNCQFPIWANVKVLNSTKALEELWDTSEDRDIILAVKSTGDIAQIYLEEDKYKGHVGKCDVMNIDQNDSY